MITRQVSALPQGHRFARAVKSLLVSRGDLLAAADHAAQYRDSPEVSAMLQQKALMPAMTTADAAVTDFGMVNVQHDQKTDAGPDRVPEHPIVPRLNWIRVSR